MGVYRVGLVGAPSSGKSKIIEGLGNRGYKIYEEAASSIIKVRTSTGESLEQILSDPQKFQDEIYEMKLNQYLDAGNHEGISFFDTTFIDDIAHRRMSLLDCKSALENAISRRYDQVFFIQHPGIVENNGIRVENLQEVEMLDSLKIHALKQTRTNYIPIPIGEELNGEEFSGMTNIEKRIKFLLDRLNA